MIVLDLPPPVECGLPDKFPSWRPQQLDAMGRSFDSEKRFIGDGLTTGSGKSLRAVGEAVIAGKRALYLTASKGLQDQIASDFSSIGIADVRGKNAYKCRGFPQWSCEEGQMLRCSHIKQGTCPHAQATQKALRAPIVSTNYHCYITNHMTPRQEGPPWGDFQFLILDEAHEAPDILSDIIGMNYTSTEIVDLLESQFPEETPDDWVKFAKEKIGPLKKTIQAFEQSYANCDPGEYAARRLIYMKRLLTKLERTAQLCGEADWLIEKDDASHVRLEALWPTSHTEKYLFREIKKVLLMSAMLTRKTCKLFGIPDNDLSFHEYSSPFDPARCPLYIITGPREDPMPPVGFKMTPTQIRKWHEWMNIIALSRLNTKGIYHSVSFHRAQQIYENSKVAKYMIVPEQGNGMTAKAVAEFKRSPAPRALVSPSITTGYNFPHDECRWQIHAKIPIPDTRSAIINARCKVDKDYRGYLTVMKIIQACGRGMRSADDWCENFLPDGHHKWFFRQNWHMMPQWFQRTIKVVPKVPDAPRIV